MSFYYCSSCNKRIELKYKKTHLKSELHMNTEGTVINKHAIMNPELCDINNIIINNGNNYGKRFELYKIVCKWKLVFVKAFSIDVQSKAMYRNSVIRHIFQKHLKIKIKYYRRQGLEFSHKSEINNSFITSLDFLTYKHYMEQPMPMVEMVERIVNRRLYK